MKLKIAIGLALLLGTSGVGYSMKRKNRDALDHHGHVTAFLNDKTIAGPLHRRDVDVDGRRQKTLSRQDKGPAAMKQGSAETPRVLSSLITPVKGKRVFIRQMVPVKGSPYILAGLVSTESATEQGNKVETKVISKKRRTQLQKAINRVLPQYGLSGYVNMANGTTFIIEKPKLPQQVD